MTVKLKTNLVRQTLLVLRIILVTALLLSLSTRIPAAQQWYSPLLQNHPLTGKIFRTSDGKELEYSNLLQQLKQARFILIGEKHDNPDHHILEHKLLTDLQQGNKTRMVLEMLNQRQGLGYLSLNSESNEQTIKSALNWPDKGWPWNDYAELITATLADNNELRGGNIQRSILMDIYRDQAPDEARFQSIETIPESIWQTVLQQVYISHCKTIPKEQMTPMARIQLSRDASMAWQLKDQLQPEQKGILFAGAFHTRKDIGVMQHFNTEQQQQAVALTLQEVEPGAELLTDYPSGSDSVADFIWFTPKFSDQDYCASLRKSEAQDK